MNCPPPPPPNSGFYFHTFCMHDFHKKNKNRHYFYNNFTIMYKCQLNYKKNK